MLSELIKKYEARASELHERGASRWIDTDLARSSELEMVVEDLKKLLETEDVK